MIAKTAFSHRGPKMPLIVYRSHFIVSTMSVRNPIFNTISYPSVFIVVIANRSKRFQIQLDNINNMTFNNDGQRMAFAAGLTAFIFATIIAIICLVVCRESRRAHQAETAAQDQPPAPTPDAINLSRLSINRDFRESDDTLVAPAVSAETRTRESC